MTDCRSIFEMRFKSTANFEIPCLNAVKQGPSKEKENQLFLTVGHFNFKSSSQTRSFINTFVYLDSFKSASKNHTLSVSDFYSADSYTPQMFNIFSARMISSYFINSVLLSSEVFHLFSLSCLGLHAHCKCAVQCRIRPFLSCRYLTAVSCDSLIEVG